MWIAVSFALLLLAFFSLKTFYSAFNVFPEIDSATLHIYCFIFSSTITSFCSVSFFRGSEQHDKNNLLMMILKSLRWLENSREQKGRKGCKNLNASTNSSTYCDIIITLSIKFSEYSRNLICATEAKRYLITFSK